MIEIDMAKIMNVTPCETCKAPLKGSGFFTQKTHTPDCTWVKAFEQLTAEVMGKAAIIQDEAAAVQILPPAPCQLCQSKVHIQQVSGANGHIVSYTDTGGVVLNIWVPCTNTDREMVFKYEKELRARQIYDRIIAG